ncbi:hypothetical protein [Azospirillum melinis]
MGHGDVPGRALKWKGKPVDEGAVLEPVNVKTSLLESTALLQEWAPHHPHFREWCATAQHGSPSQLLFQSAIIECFQRVACQISYGFRRSLCRFAMAAVSRSRRSARPDGARDLSVTCIR